MNKVFKFFGGALVGLLTITACSPDDYNSPNGQVPIAADYEDNVSVSVDQETNTATFTFASAKGVTPVWYVDGNVLSSQFTVSRQYTMAGEYTVECRVRNANGMSDGTIAKTFTIDKSILTGFVGFDNESDKNLWKGTTVTPASTFYATGEDWHDPGQPISVQVGSKGKITVGLPVGTTKQWQAQVPFETNISTVADPEVTYVFSCILTSNQDHPGVTIKLTNPTDDNDYYFAEQQELKKGVPTVFYMTDLDSRTIDNLKLFFDFGGNADDTEISIENITFMKSSDNDRIAPDKLGPEPAWVDINSSDNLWNTANPVLGETFYATGDDWHDPGQPLNVAVKNGNINIKIPVATYSRWQCQVPFELTLGIEAGEEYDFIAIVESSADFTAHFKLTDATDDNNFLFAKDVKLFKGGENRWFVTHQTIPNTAATTKLFFDFGTCPDNTEITIKDIILQKHRE